MVAMRWIVLVVVLGGAGTASATVKLCLGPPTGPAIAVPPEPTFVVANNEVEAAATKGAKESVTAIDSYRSRVTVHARPGQVFVRGIGCDRQRFRVTAGWSNRAALPVPIETELGANGESVFVRWQRGPQLTFTRIDWAYRAEDLDTDLYASYLEEESTPRDLSSVNVDAPPTARVIHLRLTRYSLDGSIHLWRGWLEREGDHVRIRTGPAPDTERASGGPCHGVARAVPTTPTFRTHGWDTPRFVAMTCDGRLLPVTRSISNEPTAHVATTVSARDGERFWLRRLPLAPGAPTEPLLVATTDRYLEEAPVVTSASAPGCSARLKLAHATTWDHVEVASLALDGSNGTTEERHRSLADDVSVPTLIASPQLVRMTPIWGTQRGRSWFGWAHSDGCDEASFGSATPAAPPIESPRAITRNPARRWPMLLALLGLALGWVVLRRLTRTDAGG
jgi:hypothetical protein